MTFMGFICSTKKPKATVTVWSRVRRPLGVSDDHRINSWEDDVPIVFLFLCRWLVFWSIFLQIQLLFSKGIFVRNKFEVLKKSKNSGPKNG